MTPAERFANDELKRATLEGVLRSPELHEALRILKDELEPEATDAAALGNPQLAVSQRHLVAGANHILKGLQRLTLIPPKPQRAPRAKPLLSEAEFLKQKAEKAAKK